MGERKEHGMQVQHTRVATCQERHSDHRPLRRPLTPLCHSTAAAERCEICSACVCDVLFGVLRCYRCWKSFPLDEWCIIVSSGETCIVWSRTDRWALIERTTMLDVRSSSWKVIQQGPEPIGGEICRCDFVIVPANAIPRLGVRPNEPVRLNDTMVRRILKSA